MKECILCMSAQFVVKFVHVIEGIVVIAYIIYLVHIGVLT